MWLWHTDQNILDRTFWFGAREKNVTLGLRKRLDPFFKLSVLGMEASVNSHGSIRLTSRLSRRRAQWARALRATLSAVGLEALVGGHDAHAPVPATTYQRSGRRCRNYLARFQPTSSVEPDGVLGITNFNSSAVMEVISRFCSPPPIRFANVLPSS
jgi:hypothetical protein